MKGNREARLLGNRANRSYQSSFCRFDSTAELRVEKATLLDRFPQSQRGWLGNLFNLSVRDGAREADSVIRAVRLKADRYLSETFLTVERKNLLTAFIVSLDETEAREYAERVLRYENLPFEERQRIKAERNGKRMESLAPTEKQFSYLRGLGCKTVPSTRAEASRLIDECLSKRNCGGGK